MLEHQQQNVAERLVFTYALTNLSIDVRVSSFLTNLRIRPATPNSMQLCRSGRDNVQFQVGFKLS